MRREAVCWLARTVRCIVRSGAAVRFSRACHIALAIWHARSIQPGAERCGDAGRNGANPAGGDRCPTHQASALGSAPRPMGSKPASSRQESGSGRAQKGVETVSATRSRASCTGRERQAPGLRQLRNRHSNTSCAPGHRRDWGAPPTAIAGKRAVQPGGRGDAWGPQGTVRSTHHDGAGAAAGRPASGTARHGALGKHFGVWWARGAG